MWNMSGDRTVFFIAFIYFMKRAQEVGGFAQLSLAQR